VNSPSAPPWVPARARIVRQLLTESIVLSITCGVLASSLATPAVRALLAVSPAGLPRVGENGAAVGLDWRIFLFTLGISLFTGILFGLFPPSQPRVSTSTPPSRKQQPLRHRLPPEQNAFSPRHRRSLPRPRSPHRAALLIRTFIALRQVNPGFDPRNVLTLEMSLTGDQFKKTAGVAQVSHDGRERLNAIPGVEISAFTCCLPLEGGYGLPFNIIGRPPAPKSPWTGSGGWMSASPRLLRRLPHPHPAWPRLHRAGHRLVPSVVLINETFGKKFFPKENPVGQQLLIGKGVGPQFTEAARQIVGVVGDIRDGGLNNDPRPLMIVPGSQVTDGMTALNSNIGPMVWLVRTHGDPHPYISAVTSQLRQSSGGFPVARVRPMTQVVGNSTAREDFNMLLLTIFGACALILAAIGIYGLMAYSVQQRTQEMGIRMALGADRSRIRSLVVWHGMRLAIVGVVIGIAAAFGLTRFIASLLFGVKTWDPAVFVTVPIILGLVALLAVWMPATRASRLDPQQALRIE